MAYAVYSLPDVTATLYHPDVGSCYLQASGVGKILIASSGDLSSHTVTSDGYVVVNRIKTTNGRIDIEVPQNSSADFFMRKWSKWARSTANSKRIALGTLTINDPNAGSMIKAMNLSLQKVPDRTYDRTSTNVTYSFLAVSITEGASGNAYVAAT